MENLEDLLEMGELKEPEEGEEDFDIDEITGGGIIGVVYMCFEKCQAIIGAIKESKTITAIVRILGLIGTSITAVILTPMLIFQYYFQTLLDIRFSLVDIIRETFEILPEEGFLTFILWWIFILIIALAVYLYINFIYVTYIKGTSTKEDIDESVALIFVFSFLYLCAMGFVYLAVCDGKILYTFTNSAWISIILSILNLLFTRMYLYKKLGEENEEDK